MRETKQETIRGIQIHTTQLTAREAFKLGPKLGALIAPAAGQLGDMTDSVQAENMGRAFGAIFMSLRDADADQLMLEVFKHTRAQRPSGEIFDLSNLQNIDLVFCADLSALVESLWFVVKVNFSGFFSEGLIGNMLAKGQAMVAASGSESAETSKIAGQSIA